MNSISLDPASNIEAREGADRYSAGDCLLAAIEVVAAAGRAARILAPSAGSVWIDPGKRCCWPAIEAEEGFFLTPSAQATIDWTAAAEPAGDPIPLEDLLWTAAWVGSGGALLDRCQPYDVVALQYWPNLTRLPHVDSLFPLCSLLSHRPSSLSFAYRMLRLPQADAFRFYSAATAAGLVRVISAQPARTDSKAGAPEAAATSAEQGAAAFWGRLFKRISGL